MKNWKLALSTADISPASAPILLNGTIPENLQTAAALGYDAIEVHTREDAPLDIPAILATYRRCPTRVAMVVTGRLNTEGRVSLIDDVPYARQAAMDGMRRYIDIASELGAGLVIGWARGKVPPGKLAESYLERLARSLRSLAHTAETQNVPLNIEVINRYEVNLLRTTRETVDFLNHYELANCFVHLDTFHMNIEETNMIDAIYTAGKRLGYVHLADNNRRYPGAGCLDFARFFRALDASGYEGYLSVECLPDPDGHTAAVRSLAHIQACIKEVCRS